MSATHKHKATHRPTQGTGWDVCECGATRRVENGWPKHHWHTCHLCVHVSPLFYAEAKG